MQSIIEAIPGHDKEVYGVSVESIITAGLLLIFILIIRELTGLIFLKYSAPSALVVTLQKKRFQIPEERLELPLEVGRESILSKIWIGLLLSCNWSW